MTEEMMKDDKSQAPEAAADGKSQYVSTQPIVRPSARAAARLFSEIVRRNAGEPGKGEALTENEVLSLSVLLEALERARDEGSVCLGVKRYIALAEGLKKAIAAHAADSDESADADANANANANASDVQPVTFDALASALMRTRLAANYRGRIETLESAPIIIDRSGAQVHVYSERSFYDEYRLARRILALAFPDVEKGAKKGEGKTAAEKASLPKDPAQRALALASSERLLVVSGGPGTGKTTIVTSVLAKLLAAQPDARIALAAPTGKAAGRMQQAVHGTARRVASDPAVAARLEALTASTIHRLLMTPQDDGSRPGKDSPLDADILVVDESSMIDMGLAIRLFDAIDLTRTRVVLLGDRHQLAAVGPGSVFADLSDTEGRLKGHIAELTVSHRFAADKAIGELSACVNAGQVETVFEKLKALDAIAASQKPEERDNSDNIVRWHREQTIASEGLTREAHAWLSRMMQSIIAAIKAHRAVLETSTDEAARLKAAQALARTMRAFGVLAAQRRGPMSVEAVNRAADARLTQEGFIGARWRQIIVRSNDPVLELYNGDVGVVVPGAPAQTGEPVSDEVFFLDSGRFVKAGLLPTSDAAFAITIHQSQGSEYHHVAVLMPTEADSPLATRELLYTAMTRVSDVRFPEGKGGTEYGTLDVFADDKVIERAVATPVTREGGLGERLAEDFKR